jgi:hypothetical protein
LACSRYVVAPDGSCKTCKEPATSHAADPRQQLNDVADAVRSGAASAASTLRSLASDLKTSSASEVARTDTACRSCTCAAFSGVGDARFCSGCGHPREDHDPRCGSCGAQDQSGEFCSACGAPLRRGAAKQVGKPAGIAQTFGDATGRFAGHTVRSGVSTAAEPIVDKVWRERPELPTWQKATGVVTWPILIFQPVGWMILVASFLVQVVLGRQNPYQWAVWITKWSGVLLLICFAVGVPILLTIMASEPS